MRSVYLDWLSLTFHMEMEPLLLYRYNIRLFQTEIFLTWAQEFDPGICTSV